MPESIGWIQRLRGGVRRLLVRSTFQPMERLLPVNRRLWCFGTWGAYPHTQDNIRAVFEQVKHDPAIEKVVLTGGGPVPEFYRDGVNVRFVPVESLSGMYAIARCAALLIGFSLISLSSYSRYVTRKHAVVQLWHGIPLKKIGHLFSGEGWWREETPLYAATVCSSERDQAFMQQAFAPLPLERVWLTGLPRNDIIVEPEQDLPRDYRRTLDELRGRLAGRKLVLYAPTWREEANSHYAFSADEVAALERLLVAHNAVFAIRGHSNVRGNDAYARDYSSGVFLNLNDLPDVNLALRLTDVLVTDYSSIYIDFLLADRPVVHFAYDLAAYRVERGFLYDLEEAFAAPATESFTDLLAELERSLTEPRTHADRRASARRLFHTHAGQCGQAVADRVRQLLQPDSAPSARTQRQNAAGAATLPT